MFASSFDYRRINSQPKTDDKGVNTIEHNYSFKGKGGSRYTVICEQFEFNVYVVKFYSTEHKYCVHKFNRLTGRGECSRVMTTVGQIMLQLFKENHFASFAFLGSPLKGEEKNNTKRFKLYSRVVENLVSPVNFEHHSMPNHSAYIMLNRSNNEENLLRKIEEMFNRVYEF